MKSEDIKEAFNSAHISFSWIKANKYLPESVIGLSKTKPNETDSVLVKLHNGSCDIDKRVYVDLNNANYSWFWHNYTDEDIAYWKPINKIMKSEDIKEAFKILSLWGCKFEDTVFYDIYCKKEKL